VGRGWRDSARTGQTHDLIYIAETRPHYLGLVTIFFVIVVGAPDRGDSRVLVCGNLFASFFLLVPIVNAANEGEINVTPASAHATACAKQNENSVTTVCKLKFERSPIGCFHVDLAEVRTAEGKLYLFVAIDRTSKFAFVELVERADMQAAARFLEALVAAVPYRIHTVLTDNGIQFADLPKNRKGPTARFRGHPFDRVCLRHGIDHRLTKPNHP
jgi:Integrase core domain